MSEPIRQGHLYWVPDSAIHLPPNEKRLVHKQRPYLVVSTDCFVLIPLAQAMAKSKLMGRMGQLDANLREAVTARFLAYLGFISSTA